MEPLINDPPNKGHSTFDLYKIKTSSEISSRPSKYNFTFECGCRQPLYNSKSSNKISWSHCLEVPT